MKRAPCINAGQSTMQEAHTTPEGVRAIITRPPPEIKEEFMNQALQAIAERYGVRPCRVPEFVPSGLPALDAVTGGIPVGRIVDIHGAEDSGKTALALALARGTTLFLDGECKLNPAHVRDPGNFWVMRPETLEGVLEVCRTAAQGFDTVIVDSIEAFPIRTEQELSLSVMFGSYDGSREKLLSRALPILARELCASGCTLILVNQMRNRQGVMYGRVDLSTGGRALTYYAALRLELNRVEYVRDRQDITGQKDRVWASKCKYRTPGGRADLLLDYRRGWLGVTG